jgi:hypothetical protein
MAEQRQPCALRLAAEQFRETLEIADLNNWFDAQHDRCYCSECYLARWPDTLSNDGPTPYVVPRGWFRFGLKLDANVFGVEGRSANPVFPGAQEFFDTWSVCYHGVKSRDTLRSIIQMGTLMKPGDRLPDGTVLRSTKCAGRQDNVFYTSPTVKYAGLKFYAEPQEFGDGLAASMVVQIRQRPGSFVAQGETMAFEKRWANGRGPWPGHLAQHCPHVDLDTIEWKSEDTSGAIPYGVLIRPFVFGADEELQTYRSPVDLDVDGLPRAGGWKARELQAAERVGRIAADHTLEALVRKARELAAREEETAAARKASQEAAAARAAEERKRKEAERVAKQAADEKAAEQEAAKVAASLQLEHVYGVTVASMPLKDWNGTYLRVGQHEGWWFFDSYDGKRLWCAVRSVDDNNNVWSFANDTDPIGGEARNAFVIDEDIDRRKLPIGTHKWKVFTSDEEWKVVSLTISVATSAELLQMATDAWLNPTKLAVGVKALEAASAALKASEEAKAAARQEERRQERRQEERKQEEGRQVWEKLQEKLQENLRIVRQAEEERLRILRRAEDAADDRLGLCKGAIVWVTPGLGVGVITAGPDADDDFKVRWAGGKEISDWINRDHLRSATIEEQIEAVPWCKKDAIVWLRADGSEEYKVGIVVADPDSDAEIRVRWAGTERIGSWYVPVVTVRRASIELQKAAVPWCTVVGRGAIAIDSDGDVGVVATVPDHEAEVKLRWLRTSHGLSGWTRVARLRQASPREQIAALEAKGHYISAGTVVGILDDASGILNGVGIAQSAPDADAEVRVRMAGAEKAEEGNISAARTRAVNVDEQIAAVPWCRRGTDVMCWDIHSEQWRPGEVIMDPDRDADVEVIFSDGVDPATSGYVKAVKLRPAPADTPCITCAACKTRRIKDEFSNRQWNKAPGQERCKDCVRTDRFEEFNARTSTSFKCTSCHTRKDRASYSTNQWVHKPAESKRCRHCVGN